MGDCAAGDTSKDGDLCVWIKPNVSSTGGNRLTQTVEFILVLRYGKNGMVQDSHFNYDKSDNRNKHWIYRRVQKKVQPTVVSFC